MLAHWGCVRSCWGVQKSPCCSPVVDCAPTGETLRLLYNRWALEYYDDQGGVWLDVHPLVIEIDEFQDAYRRRRATTGA